ncbi:aminoacyl-tRNA hydrolase [Buchnera aphidicola]|uniref:aminoacyl-tRNA hydrolase n=1 Tax=Buchnera aphidicola TaxID=9 RepID=UPI0034648B4D
MIVGLSNPTFKYHNTRHNIGAWYIHLLCKYNNINMKREQKFFGDIAQYKLKNSYIWLLVPNTFMNVSGISVYAVSNFYRINIQEILVVHDELDLPVGTIKLKYGYGHNGHNGLRNIISQFGNKNKFCRIRIGIGRPEYIHEITSFVLSKPTKYEKSMILKVIHNVIQETNTIIEQKKLFITSQLYSVH